MVITIQEGVIVPMRREAIEGCSSEIYSILSPIDPRLGRIFEEKILKVVCQVFAYRYPGIVGDRERVDDAGEFIRQQKRLDKDEGTEGFDHG